MTGFDEEHVAETAVLADAAFRRGTGTAGFRNAAEVAGLVVPDTEVAGPNQINRWHANLVYDQQATTMLAADTWLKADAGRADRPYGEYLAILDGETRPDHAALDGVIKPLDDPFWNAFWPPWDYNCRCEVVTVSQDELTDEGLSVTDSVPAGAEVNPDWAFSRHDSFLPDDVPQTESGIADTRVLVDAQSPRDLLSPERVAALQAIVDTGARPPNPGRL